MVPLVRAKKLAPWLLPPHMAALAAEAPDGHTELAKLQLTCALSNPPSMSRTSGRRVC